MKTINKYRLGLFGLAFIHMNLIATGIIFSPFGFLNNIIVIGNIVLLIFNGFILGFTFAFNKELNKRKMKNEQ